MRPPSALLRNTSTTKLTEGDTNGDGIDGVEQGYGSIINLTPEETGSWLKQRKRKIFRKKTLYKRLPILQWLPNYCCQDLIADVVAGISVGVTLIPQALAYATVAGLPPQYGLYTAYVGCFVYIFLGSVMPITIGPTALLALLTYDRASIMGPQGAIFLAFSTGIIQLLLGLLNFGFLLDFVATPVIAGFASAAAVTIATTQVKSLLGLSFPSAGFIDTWLGVFTNIAETRTGDAVMGFVSVALLLLLKGLFNVKLGDDSGNRTRSQKVLNSSIWFLSTSRNALMIFIGAVIAWSWPVASIEDNPFTLTGNITGGLPVFSPPPFYIENGNQTYNFFEICQTLGSNMIVTPLIAILESVTIAKAFTKGQKVDASQEMIAVGTTNVIGSFLSAFPATGSFSRTAVNVASGVRSPMGGIFTGSIALLATSVLCPYLYYIPKSCLAAVIITAVIFMVDFHLVVLVWRSRKLDLIPLLLTFLFCTLVSLQVGILVGVAVNLAMLIYSTGQPKIQISHIRSPRADYLLVTPDRSLVFTAMDNFLSKVRKTLVNHRDPYAKPLVIDLRHVPVVDFSTADGFKHLHEELKGYGHEVILTNVCPKVLSVLQGIGTAFQVHQSGSDIQQFFPETESQLKVSIPTEDDRDPTSDQPY